MDQESEIKDGMRIEWDVPIKMDDGIVLRADVYQPVKAGKYPSIITYGPYGKGLSFQEGYSIQWKKMIQDYPEILNGSTNKYLSWEVPDPEQWVPHGYVVIRVDSRGAGCSPGVLNPQSPREDEDLYQCIEWAATQPWCDGKVGMLGISYFAINQWRIAAKQPPHLKAIIPWEGFNDNYRDATYHGGILSGFLKKLASIQLLPVQYGVGDRGKKNLNTGKSVAGPVTLSDEELAKNLRDPYIETKAHPFDDEWHKQRSADLSKITIPLLSCANWGGHGIHIRGNFNGFTEASSSQKWLEVHGDTHWSLFYSDYGLSIQKRFFDYFLKNIDNGWDKTPRVQLNVRYPGDKFVLRMENEWPIARTKWTKLYIDPNSMSLNMEPLNADARINYDALSERITFSTPPMEEELEITGPIAAKLFISSSTKDADLFLIFRVFDPDGNELTFQGALDPNSPVSMGWLRASHRRLDAKRSKPYQPYHPHDRAEPLIPGEIYECDIEILSTSVVVPKGWRIALTICGKDFEYEGDIDEFGKEFHYATRGTGGITHVDPDDRPEDIFGGTVSLHTGGGRDSYLLIPIVPAKDF